MHRILFLHEKAHSGDARFNKLRNSDHYRCHSIKTRRIYLQQVLQRLTNRLHKLQISVVKAAQRTDKRDVHVTSNARCAGRAFNFLVRAVGDVRKTSLKVTDVMRAAY